MVMSTHTSHPEIVKRLKRAEGHLRSIITMLEGSRNCLEIAQQLQAVESAVAMPRRRWCTTTSITALNKRCAAIPRTRTKPSASSKPSPSISEGNPMTSFSALLAQGTANAWLFIPSAILLGGLHGLEPGHSKTMMAAFIVAIRGTVAQAVLLGISATISHTAVVWVIALGGMYFGQKWDAETSEPYLQVASAVLIIGVALWMMWRTGGNSSLSSRVMTTITSIIMTTPNESIPATVVVRLEVFEDGVPPRFRLFRESGHGHTWTADQVRIETERPDGSMPDLQFRAARWLRGIRAGDSRTARVCRPSAPGP
jgi:hypothetical protein